MYVSGFEIIFTLRRLCPLRSEFPCAIQVKVEKIDSGNRGSRVWVIRLSIIGVPLSLWQSWKSTARKFACICIYKREIFRCASAATHLHVFSDPWPMPRVDWTHTVKTCILYYERERIYAVSSVFWACHYTVCLSSFLYIPRAAALALWFNNRSSEKVSFSLVKRT